MKSLNYEVTSTRQFHDVDDGDLYIYYRIAIYSSETKSWRLCRNTYHDPYNTICKPGVPWDGCLHWVNLVRNTHVYFNIDREELIALPVSNEIHGKDRVYFGEWMGHLHLIVRDWELPYCWDVLEMEINYRRWKPICRINIDELANRYQAANGGGNLYKYYFAVAQVVVEGDDVVGDLRAFIHLIDNSVISYDLKRNSFKEICKDNNMFRDYSRRHAHIESLANVV